MSSRIAGCIGVLSSVAAASLAHAAPSVRDAVERVSPGIKVDEPTRSPIHGLYHVTLDGTSGYVTQDGRYFIAGDLFEVASRRNLTEDARKGPRMQALDALSGQMTILFAPADPKHTLTIFTDVDCGYCRKLHSEIAEYNKLGLAVRYVAYPRSGPGSESWRKMEAVWCSVDPREALTRAKRGESVERSTDCSAPEIEAQYRLGKSLGLQGTPMIILEDGSTIGGYLPPAQLAAEVERRLETSRTAKRAQP